MLAIAFGLAGLVEVVGVALILDDLGRRRRAAQSLIERSLTEPMEFDEDTMRLFPGSLQHRKRMLDQKYATDEATEAGEHVRRVLIDLLQPSAFEWRHPGRWHHSPIFGPILIVLGIIIGTVANIRAL